jgi:cytochrome c oxidase subunit 1
MSESESQPAAAEHHDHHEESFWTKYVFSQDHKVIGLQYGITALVFMLFGFCLMLLMRWQLAYPGKPVPLLGGLASMSRGFIYGGIALFAVLAVYLLRGKAAGALRGLAVSLFSLTSIFLFVTLVARLLSDANAPGGIILPEFYNQLGAMHGTIMVFLAVVPMLVGAFW